MACDVWRVACDVWRVTCGVWRVTCEERGVIGVSEGGCIHYVRHINADNAAGVTAVSGVEEHRYTLSDHAHELEGFRV